MLVSSVGAGVDEEDGSDEVVDGDEDAGEDV